MKPFEYVEPNTIEEALLFLDQYGAESKVLAGGTDLIVQLKQKLVQVRYVINIKKIKGLNHIQCINGKALKIGPLATLSSISDSEVVRDKFKIIYEASRAVGTPQVRNIATIGGNICNAAPSADMAPALIALRAQVRIKSAHSERVVPIENLFVGPYKTCLDSKEILAEIEIPFSPMNSAGHYMWLPKYASVNETLVGCAILITLGQNLREIKDIGIGLSAVAPIPMRAVKSEKILRGKKIDETVFEKAGEIASEESKPIARFGISAEYRREMVKILVKRCLKKAVEDIQRFYQTDRDKKRKK